MTDGHCQMAREEKARKRREREKTEEPSLAEAIDETKIFLKILAGPGECLQKKDFFTAARGRAVPALRRLVEAGEFEKACHDSVTGCPRFNNLSAEKDRQLQALRRQLDALGKELDDKDRRYEKMDEGYSHQIASLSMEVERLEDELDDLRLSTTPGFVDAMALIDKGLTKGKLEIEKVRRVTKLPPDDAPTEAEVEKVAKELGVAFRKGAGLKKELPFSEMPKRTQQGYMNEARLVIAGGYRRGE